MNVLQNGNLALRFVLELAALAALSVCGFVTPEATWLKVLLGIAIPSAAGLAWGLFVSPKAKVDAHWTIRAAVEGAVFAGAAASLFAIDRSGLAVGFVFLALLSRSIKTAFDLRASR